MAVECRRTTAVGVQEVTIMIAGARWRHMNGRSPMTAYLPILLLHILCALVTPWLFTARVVRAARGQDPAVGLLRWLPHTVDTVLFGAGVTMAVLLGVSPSGASWLGAKLVALLLYILIGHVAVRRVRSNRSRLVAWLSAMLVIGYIYSVAITKNPWVFSS